MNSNPDPTTAVDDSSASAPGGGGSNASVPGGGGSNASVPGGGGNNANALGGGGSKESASVEPGDFVALVQAGDVAQVRNALQGGADPNSVGRGEFSVVFAASGRAAKVPSMTTALLEAVKLNSPDMVRLLLDFGADPRVKAPIPGLGLHLLSHGWRDSDLSPVGMAFERVSRIEIKVFELNSNNRGYGSAKQNAKQQMDHITRSIALASHFKGFMPPAQSFYVICRYHNGALVNSSQLNNIDKSSAKSYLKIVMALFESFDRVPTDNEIFALARHLDKIAYFQKLRPCILAYVNKLAEAGRREEDYTIGNCRLVTAFNTRHSDSDLTPWRTSVHAHSLAQVALVSGRKPNVVAFLQGMYNGLPTRSNVSITYFTGAVDSDPGCHCSYMGVAGLIIALVLLTGGLGLIIMMCVRDDPFEPFDCCATRGSPGDRREASLTDTQVASLLGRSRSVSQHRQRQSDPRLLATGGSSVVDSPPATATAKTGLLQVQV